MRGAQNYKRRIAACNTKRAYGAALRQVIGCRRTEMQEQISVLLLPRKSNAKMLSPVERLPIKSIICDLRGISNRRTADGAAELMKSCVDVRRLRRSFRHPSNPLRTDAHRRTLSFFSADRQHTYQPVFSKHLEIGVNCSTSTKSTKTIVIRFITLPAL